MLFLCCLPMLFVQRNSNNRTAQNRDPSLPSSDSVRVRRRLCVRLGVQQGPHHRWRGHRGHAQGGGLRPHDLSSLRRFAAAVSRDGAEETGSGRRRRSKVGTSASDTKQSQISTNYKRWTFARLVHTSCPHMTSVLVGRNKYIFWWSMSHIEFHRGHKKVLVGQYYTQILHVCHICLQPQCWYINHAWSVWDSSYIYISIVHVGGVFSTFI